MPALPATSASQLDRSAITGAASSTIEKLEGRIEELRESPTLGFTTFIDTAQINALERKLDELRRARGRRRR